MTVNTEGCTEATFVSGISRDACLQSEVIKANTTFFSATKLVVPLTTSTLVGAFAIDAIIKAKANKMYDLQANELSGQLKVFHKGLKMETNELVHTYMGEDERKCQVANGITIDFAESTQTSLTIEQLAFVKESVTIVHPISHRLPPITALGSKGFSEMEIAQKIMVFQF